ncbi:GH36 C-terminal domain-containing protein, partial [Streptococcus suis]|uniref:GH36 C-terminal domain-containing protein n=1 Tax=Streptococcus suis TaxID=1307 RepID=UPI0006CD5C57
EITAWQVQSLDGQQVIVGYYRRVTKANLSYQSLYLQGLGEGAGYHLGGEGYTGSQLMHTGLSIRHGDHG